MNQDRKNKHVAAGDHQRLHAGSHGIAQQLAEAAAVLLAGTLHIAERLAKPGRAAPAAAVRSGRFRGVPGRGTIPPKNIQRDPGGQSGGPVHGEQKQAEFGAAEKTGADDDHQQHRAAKMGRTGDSFRFACGDFALLE